MGSLNQFLKLWQEYFDDKISAQKNLGLFFSTNKMLEEQQVRNKRIIERLKKTGIIAQCRRVENYQANFKRNFFDGK